MLTSLFFFFLFTVTSGLYQANGATCTPGECPSGWYVCDSAPYASPPQTDDTCCYENGCPSSECEDVNKCCWYGESNACTYATSGVCPSSNTETSNCWATTRSECLADGCCWVGLKCVTKKPSSCPASKVNFECSIDPDDKCSPCSGNTEESCTDTAPDAASLINPADGAELFGNTTVLLDWGTPAGWGENCAGAESNIYRVFVDSGAGFVQQGGDIYEPTTELLFSLDTMAAKNYKWYVVTDNGVKTNTSATRSFSSNPSLNLTINVQEISMSSSFCPASALRSLAGVSITVSVSGVTETYSVVSGTDGSVKIPVKYATATPAQMTICSTYSEGMCQSYGLRCADLVRYDAPQNCVTVPQTTVATTQSTTLQLSKIKKDPWVAVVDGDAYAKSFTNPGPCSTETQVLGGFYGGMLNLNKLSLGSNIYALSVGNSSFPGDISEGTGGGYAKNIGVAQDEAEEIKIPENAKSMTNLGGYIRPDVYKMSITDFNNSSGLYYFLRSGIIEVSNAGSMSAIYAGVKCYPGDINYRPGSLDVCIGITKTTRIVGCTLSSCFVYNGNISPRVGFIYVQGNPSQTLIIDSPIRGIGAVGMTTEPGTVVILTKARVKIDASLATPLASYTVDSPPQVEAVIISSSGIEVGSNYTEATPDNPVVFYGSLISTKPGASPGKGIQILRDLGLDNNTYPAVVVNYPLDMLDRVSKSIKFNSKWGKETGLEVFDVKYEFDDVTETVD
ncbi:hypothetical protein A3K01_01800 [candidate division WWE3 bacterium RIFOXYD1_FULL_43_17]|uniref:Fibronectin type-III domain-containing protein n=3 Tax=Katanobacteria TaxID=422282 RepID=A0A1F4XBE8_UNCKA|nr:MAG: hypothetical protein UU59_C0011G0013 [candidate division WWE3 bacterium GW2011_GWE1_41_27]KKS60316.1 MAG: hypothetical protein UV26_C0005G0004 [candidate division WWE3 bacterium GW2011_GWF2_42_42]OGC79025.1 MAG: hypothetical protein A3K01_01800 [candidate division WWE3 bacterium RIFOXYD1_FULL_43_17]